ncbi:MAG: DNA repair protein RecO [Hyphomonadaceae bacterium JAD_PAG50586_4]|nr:MAG: DNA repair protein RecO [Hyphomonadaceae bacterium JAD_PAG50586_4]
MEWVDDAIVLGARHFGEGKLVAEVFSREHGRYGGVVHAGRKSQPILQAGNVVHAGWKARLSEQLGFYSPLELIEPHATRLLDDPIALAGLSSAVTLIRSATPERQAYPQLYDALIVLIEAMPHHEIWPAIYARFELGLLSAMGYGLDLSRCAVTGQTENLAWVSPRTGRAATYDAGAPHAELLLRLPPFLVDAEAELREGDVADAFALAGYFLERRVFDQRGENLPETRRRLIERLGFAGRL